VIGEEGTLVFELAKEPPATLAGQLRHRVKVDAGLSCPVEVRTNEQAEEEAEGQDQVPAQATGRVAVVKRLAELMPAVKSGLAGPDATRVQALLSTVRGLIDKQDFPQASIILDEVESLVKKAPTPRAAPDDGARGAILKRLNGLSGPLKTALAGPNAVRLQALLVSVNGLIRNGDFSKAAKLLDELEPLVTAGPGVPGAAASSEQPAASAQPGSIVALQKARLAYDAARKKAHGEVVKLQQAMLAEFQGDPELPEAQKAALKLEAALAGFDDQLLDKLDEAINANTPELREERQLDAADIVDNYFAYLQGHPFLNQVDENPFVKVSVGSTLAATLNLLGDKLRA
jgi:hypothetical protein